MKKWIKRTLIGVFGASVLFGSLAACSHGPRHGHGWQAMSEEDAAKMKSRMVEKVASKLELDEAQKAKLGIVADKLREQRNALVAGGNPRAEVQSLVAGSDLRPRQGEVAGRREDGCDQHQEPGADRRLRRLLRQPAPRAAGQGARVHEPGPPWLARLMR